MNKENRQAAANNNGAGNPTAAPQFQAIPGGAPTTAAEKKPETPCKFEELKDDFLVQREIGRGKCMLFLIVIPHICVRNQLKWVFVLIGSYGVVFKAIRNEKKLQGQPLNHKGDTVLTHNQYNHSSNYNYVENSSDVDENGNIKKYAIKRIFPTINAAFILIEMLILKYLNGENNVTELIQGYRLEG